MPGLYAVYKVFSSGEILTAADLNNCLTQYITYAEPISFDDYSADVATYHSTSTPTHTSLPTTLAGELQHLRGAIKRITGESNWDDAPDSNIATLYSYIGTNYSPNITMVWKDAATITIQAGYYFCGNAYLNLSVATDWSWVLDTGTEGNGWYYMYLANVAGTATPVVSLTAPTSRLNTNLSNDVNDYDANVYLGAFYNGSGDIVRFLHFNKNFKYLIPQSVQSETGTNYVQKTISVPTTASIGSLLVYAYDTADAEDYGLISTDGTNLFAEIAAGSKGGHANNFYMEIPLFTVQSVWLKRVDADSMNCSTVGWFDKWL
jgi:hypothetical protein